jgi:GNAT superfamily N-acetyltransferase
MEFIYTNGYNKDFIELCNLLDTYLNDLVGGEANRSEYLQYNTLDDINDVVLAYENNYPIGCASFKYYDEGIAEVKRVFIKKEYRRKGISEFLMRRLEQRAAEKGYYKLVLETGAPLVEAMGLYNKIGFSVIENYGQYKCMKESICMGKDISLERSSTDNEILRRKIKG